MLSKYDELQIGKGEKKKKMNQKLTSSTQNLPVASKPKTSGCSFSITLTLVLALT